MFLSLLCSNTEWNQWKKNQAVSEVRLQATLIALDAETQFAENDSLALDLQRSTLIGFKTVNVETQFAENDSLALDLQRPTLDGSIIETPDPESTESFNP